MKTNFFIQSKYLSDLYLKDILIHYDYPRIFICEDFFGSLYLFSEFESESSYDTWIVQQISNKRYYDLFMRKISIQGSFREPEIMKYFIITKKYDEDNTVETVSYVLPENSITDYDTYVDHNSTITEETFDDLIKHNSDIIRLTFFEGTKKNNINLKLINSIMSNFINFYESVQEPNLESEPEVSFHQGSLIMEIKLNERPDIFSQRDDRNTLKNINKFFYANNDESLIDALDKKPERLTKYKSLLNSLKNIDTPMKISSTYVDSKETKTITLETSDISNKINMLDRIYEKSSKEIHLNGHFKSINLKSKTFIFIEDDSLKVYNGNIDTELTYSTENYLVGETKYKVILEATTKTTRNLDTSLEKESFKLMSLQIVKNSKKE